MQHIKAPSETTSRYRTLFLAGGIVRCPDWQADVARYLSDIEDLTVYNPRRENYPMDDPSQAQVQITWERERLLRSDIIVFWFSRGSVNPIVFFELGGALERRNQTIVVGVDPEFERIADVEIQTHLQLPDLKIHHCLPGLANEARRKLKVLRSS